MDRQRGPARLLMPDHEREVAVEYRIREDVSAEALSALRSASWEEASCLEWPAILSHSLTWVTAHQGGRLVGFVNVAWDGGVHAFLLDVTVHPTMRRRGIGTALVRSAAEAASQAEVEWLHVDYEPHLSGFYERCGFRATKAGLIRLGK